jgi:hypothetical protein
MEDVSFACVIWSEHTLRCMRPTMTKACNYIRMLHSLYELTTDNNMNAHSGNADQVTRLWHSISCHLRRANENCIDISEVRQMHPHLRILKHFSTDIDKNEPSGTWTRLLDI